MRRSLSLALAALLLALPHAAAPALEFLGAAGPFDKGQRVPTERSAVNGTLGGFSGLAFDAATADEWWMISDRGGKLWKVGLALDADGRLAGGRGAVSWLSVWQLRVAAAGATDERCPGGACTTLDSEGVAAGCTDDPSLVLVSTEGPADVLSVDAATGVLRATGSPTAADLSGGSSFWAGADGSDALGHNQMLESLTCSRGGAVADPAHPHVVFSGFENPAIADDHDSANTRVLAMDPGSGELVRTKAS